MRISTYADIGQINNFHVAPAAVDESRPLARKIESRPPIILSPVRDGLGAARNVVTEVNDDWNFCQPQKIFAGNTFTDGGEETSRFLGRGT